jgi:hypothetical protein
LVFGTELASCQLSGAWIFKVEPEILKKKKYCGAPNLRLIDVAVVSLMLSAYELREEQSNKAECCDGVRG